MNCGNWFVHCNIHKMYLSLSLQCQISQSFFVDISKVEILQLETPLCFFQDIICIPFVYLSKSLSTYVTEVNNGAFCCRVLVKWTRFLGAREWLQKGRSNRGDIPSCELGFWVFSASHFLRRNCVRFDKILTAWVFPSAIILQRRRIRGT
jgi:hypothetical protein